MTRAARAVGVATAALLVLGGVAAGQAVAAAPGGNAGGSASGGNAGGNAGGIGGGNGAADLQTPSGAVSTTINQPADAPDGTGADLCQNGNPEVNCNQYYDKRFVWLTGLPSQAGLSDGTYFFTVVVPGGQGNNNDANPNDGTDKNLSDTVLAPRAVGDANGDGSLPPSGDSYTDRTFTLTNGLIGYAGTHDFDGHKIRVFPYDDTTNPGGVYTLAVCRYSPASTPATPAPGVNPSNCKYDNFSIVERKIPPAEPLAVSKNASGSYTTTYTWDVDKSVAAGQEHLEQSEPTATVTYQIDVTHDGGTVSNVTVNGDIQVTNPNAADVTGVAVSDVLGDGTVCQVVGGAAATVPASGTLTLPYSCELDALPVSALSNTVTVDWPAQDLAAAGALAEGTAAFTFDDIAFAENVVDGCVTVSDPLAPTALGTVCRDDLPTVTFSYDAQVDGTAGTCVTQTNTATILTGTTATELSDSQDVELCVGADLTVQKTFDPSFTRSYGWDVDKSVDKTLVKQLGGSVTLNYVVDAKQTGVVDSDWAGTGTITVTNPNDWQDVTVTVTDVAAADGSCTLDGASEVTVARGSTASLAYSCTFTSGASGTNTATATWDAAAAATPNGSTDGTAPIAFTSPTRRVNRTVEVTDSWASPTAGLPATLTGTDQAPFTTAGYPYSKTVTVVDNECRDYPNTATVTGDGATTLDTASQTVRVCGGVVGGLTMGFWQNPNGQGIIKAGAAVSGVCGSGSWLRGYAPFQDLSATATCTQVASYVTTVIKSANASGASMNAMLKGQMLATALDVYFSTPALGGNKINAPAPLGGVKVDLTQICANIGSCTVFVDTRSSFGNATALTVNQLLSHAASRSNAGGSLWYGQVKNGPNSQELAKNTFDAINNAKAFAG